MKSSSWPWWDFLARVSELSHTPSGSGDRAVPARAGVWATNEGKGASATPFDSQNQTQKPQLHLKIFSNKF